MIELFPFPAALTILALTTSFAVVLGRSYLSFTGRSGLIAEVKRLAKIMKAEVSREGRDLVIFGSHQRLSAVVRFSQAEDMAALNIRMHARTNLHLSITPRSSEGREARARVQTEDPHFDSAFVTSSDDPLQAKIFLGAPGNIELLKKLCPSSLTSLTVITGKLELSEAAIPAPSTAKQVLTHMDSMARLAARLDLMPIECAKPMVPGKNGGWIARALVEAALAIALIGILHTASSGRSQLSMIFSRIGAPGVLPGDTLRIHDLGGWRAAQLSDFDARAVNWARGLGFSPNGRIAMDLSGRGENRDVAYVLMDRQNIMRMVILGRLAPLYDLRYPYIALATKVPNGVLQAVVWKEPPPGKPDGDAILVVTRPEDRASGLLFFLSEGRLVTAVPADYQSLSLP